MMIVMIDGDDDDDDYDWSDDVIVRWVFGVLNERSCCPHLVMM